MAIAKCGFRFLGFCIVYVLMIQCSVGQQPTVSLSAGTVNGVSETVSDGQRQMTIKKFLGIPFAKAPVGSLRLKQPEPLEYLDTDPYDATYQRPYCVQATSDPTLDQGEDEDCLYLNVYVPESSPDQTSGHAVMVWVYGGGFILGSADDYDGSLLAAFGNVIVVTLNYRVGFFGFFSTADAPGNFGLYDQAMAFQWVHDNIAAFGGDNSRVTIFGESAGAMSTSIHSMNEQHFGRFQRVLIQSGLVTTPYLDDINRDPTEHAMILGKAMNCETYNTYDMIECLRKYTWKDIKAALIQLGTEYPYYQTEFFKPIADGNMVLYDYKNLYDGHSAVQFFQSLDFMTGRNMYDGAEIVMYISSITDDVNTWMPSQDDMIHNLIDILGEMGIKGFPVTDGVRRSILHEYTNWTNPHSYESVRVQFVKMFTDTFYGVPAARMLQMHAGEGATGNTYAYLFSPVTSSRMPWTPSWLPGADHAEEIRSVFGLYFQYMTEWEKELSVRMMTYWSNFAKSG